MIAPSEHGWNASREEPLTAVRRGKRVAGPALLVRLTAGGWKRALATSALQARAGVDHETVSFCSRLPESIKGR